MRDRMMPRLIFSAIFIAFSFNGVTHANPQDSSPPPRVKAFDLPPDPRDIVEIELLPDEAQLTKRDNLDAAGLPAESTPFVLTLRQVYELALIKVRSPRPIWTGPEAKPFDAEALKKAGEEFGVSDFNRFRTDFTEKEKTDSFRDPSATFLKALTLRAEVDSNRLAFGTYESLHQAFKQFAAGVSDISTQNINRVELALQERRRLQSQAVLRYRNALDDLKEELGLPLDLPVLPDDSDLVAFRETFRKFDDWMGDEARDPDDLPRLLEGLPALPDIRIGDLSLGESALDSSKLQPLLQAAAKLASDVSKAPDGSVKLARRRIRSLLRAREVCPLEQRCYFLHVSEKDIAIRSLFSPPQPMHAAENTRRLTSDLVNAESAASTQQQRLVSLWTSYQVDRIALGRVLHQMPEKDWDSFLDSFKARAKTVEKPKADGAN